MTRSSLALDAPATADLHDGVTPRGWLLGNGRAVALVNAAGTGFLAADGRALTRWAGDRTADADGVFVYLRDLDSGAVWSAGMAPTWAVPDRYDVRLESGCNVVFRREDAGIATTMEASLDPDAPAECRSLEIVNASDRARRIEVTVYAEVVLASRAGDLAHPAFSKLFVETERVGERPVLLARRRPRSPDEPAPVLALAFADQTGHADVHVEHETDRLRFLGRGRDARSPLALDPGTVLSGTVGPVLDPCLALRTVFLIPPGRRAVLPFWLVSGETRDEALALVGRLAGPDPDDGPDSTATVAVETDAVPLLYGVAVPDDAAARTRLAALGLPADFLPAATYTPRPVPDAPPAPRRHAAAFRNGSAPPDQTPEPLHADNGFGGFSADATEYVVRVARWADGAHRLPPLPWSHVVANRRLGFVVTERGAGPTWGANSREHRLTPWSNDPVSDPPGEALWLRDDDTGAVWSAFPGPTPAPADYEVRYGFGYATSRVETAGLACETTQFVPTDDPVKCVRLRVENRSGRARRLSAVFHARLVLGDRAEASAPTVQVAWDGRALRATNPAAGVFADAVAFATIVGAPVAGASADRAAFLGPHRSMSAPRALGTLGVPDLENVLPNGSEPAFTLRAEIGLAPGEARVLTFLLGEGRDAAEADALLARATAPGWADAALEDAKAFWTSLLGAVRVETPDSALDLVANGWLLYQDVACRMWGRSAFYQSGGAVGFRDQLQDATALVYTRPEWLREQILLHAANQFAEGDVLHWWHPGIGGIRTRFADDLLWLPFAATGYVATTGDAGIWDARAPFLAAPLLDPGEDERFLTPDESGTEGTLYEHCVRAVDRSLATGTHGLPLMGTGDWNDGMNRVGREGRGESVWMGFFLADILRRFLPVCDARGDADRVGRYRAHLAALVEALNGPGWDGDWYRRAFYDDGTPLGTARGDECRIDAIAQAWSVLSGVAPPDRAALALDAAERHLVDEDAGLIRLLTPAFDRTPHDPGYIKGYVPGVRENGGQYTHGVLWLVRALAHAGRADRAGRLLGMLSPVARSRTVDDAERYKTEPYVVAADVYGEAPHIGRGGWTWYTGSAGWMWRTLVESVLGLGLDAGHTLTLAPCVPPEWPRAALTYRLPGCGTVYAIEIDNAAGVGTGVAAATLDGAAVAVEACGVRVPLVRDGGRHRVVVTLGPA